MDTQLQALAMHCLAHLEKEDAMLQDAWAIVNATRDALRERSPDRLRLLMEHQQESDRVSTKLTISRMELRRELARVLKIPIDQVTVARLIEQCDGTIRESLLKHQRRLRATAESINQLNQANAMLAATLVDLLQGILRRLTGTESGPPRYAANGRISVPPLP